MTEPLTKVDSAVQGLENKITSPVKEKRRASSYAEGVMNIEELSKCFPLTLNFNGP